MAKTKEQLQTEADAEIEAAKPQYIQIADGKSGESTRRERTDDEYAQAKIDLGNLKWEEQQFGYIQARQLAYPALSEQFDLLYKDMLAGKGDKTGEWYKAVKKVKDDNPKPS
jgi:hypothetical protein